MAKGPKYNPVAAFAEIEKIIDHRIEEMPETQRSLDVDLPDFVNYNREKVYINKLREKYLAKHWATVDVIPWQGGKEDGRQVFLVQLRV